MNILLYFVVKKKARTKSDIVLLMILDCIYVKERLNQSTRMSEADEIEIFFTSEAEYFEV